jgi:hypothetical protein
MVGRFKNDNWNKKKHTIHQDGLIKRVQKNSGLLIFFLDDQSVQKSFPLEDNQKRRKELRIQRTKSMLLAKDEHSLRQDAPNIEAHQFQIDANNELEKYDRRRIFLRRVLRNTVNVQRLSDSDLSLLSEMRKSESLLLDHAKKNSTFPNGIETILYKTLVSSAPSIDEKTIIELCLKLMPWFNFNKLLDLVDFVKSFISLHEFSVKRDINKFIVLWEDPYVCRWQNTSFREMLDFRIEYGKKARLKWTSKFGRTMDTK